MLLKNEKKMSDFSVRVLTERGDGGEGILKTLAANPGLKRYRVDVMRLRKGRRGRAGGGMDF